MKLTKQFRILLSTVLIISIIGFGSFFGYSYSYDENQINQEINAITITEETIWENKVVEINDSMFFNANLTIYNAIVIFKSNSTHQLEIEIGKYLNITDSEIQVENEDYNGNFKSLIGDGIFIHNTSFTHINLNINSAETSITDSTFDNCYEVELISLDDTSFIARNTFKNNETGLFLSYCSIPVLNNTFSNLDTGVIMTSCDNAVFSGNDFNNIETGVLVKSKTIMMKDNTFNNIETAIRLEEADGIHIKNNDINSVDIGIDILRTRNFDVEENTITNSDTGLYVYRSIYSTILNNEFDNIYDTAINLDDSDYIDVFENTITDGMVGITIDDNRGSIIQGNTLNSVDLGLKIIYSRTIQAIGNTIEQSKTGIYIEVSDEIILTANDIIDTPYGISIWSSISSALSSNNVLNSTEIGISFIMSEEMYMLGNEIEDCLTGLYIEDSRNAEILDGTFTNTDRAIHLLSSPRSTVKGNTFDNITDVALSIDDSNGSLIYRNNFYSIVDNNYGEISNCLVDFNLQVDNETRIGNYYDDEPPGPVLIDTVEYQDETIEIIDTNPLENEYTVPPSVSIVTRDITTPADNNIVNITAQIYKPSELEIIVTLEYITTVDEDWNTIVMSRNSSVGQINIYKGSIPELDYGLEVIYRVRVDYSVTETVFSSNNTYTVETSDETPIIIRDPSVSVRPDDDESYTATSIYYEQYNIIVQVKVINQTTNLSRIDGKNYVNISWTQFTPDGENSTSNNIMNYNATTDLYYVELGKFPAGTNITYRIYAEGEDGSFRWTLETYEINIVSETTEKSGFDSLTLLGITASLFLIQTLVVIRRRKRKEE